MKLILQVLSLLAFISLINSSRDRNNQKYKIVCYWGSWSFYRNGDGMFAAEDINPFLCTHIIYGFTSLNANNTIGFEADLDIGDTNWDSGLPWGRGMFRRFNHLRSVNPHLTTLISIGGWNEGSDKYSVMVSNPSARKTFVQSALEFMQKYDFDGFDVDWEYPTMKAVGDADREPTGNLADKQNYINLLRELHEALNPHGFILTSAVSAGKPIVDRAYDVLEMNKYLDIINLMTYDMHGAWENRTAHQSPLHSKPNDSELDKQLTVEFAINHWLKLGANPQKMVVGMALYGRSYTLKGSDTGIHAEAVGKGGKAGKFTQTEGFLAYNEICQLLKQDQWTVQRDKDQMIPYAFKGNQWVGFDDVQSLKDKVEFLKSKGLGGAMVWTVDNDDFKGLCGHGKYPLLKTISGDLNGITGPDTVIPETHITASPDTNASTTASTQTNKGTTKKHENTGSPTNTPVVAVEFKCVSKGWFKDPKDPTKFHECEDFGDGKLTDFVQSCAPGTVYDETQHVCKLP